MRLLHKFGTNAIIANRECFGIERKCCLACFFAFHDKGVTRIATHGKLFHWPIDDNQFDTGFNLRDSSGNRFDCNALKAALKKLGTLKSADDHSATRAKFQLDAGLAIQCQPTDLWG